MTIGLHACSPVRLPASAKRIRAGAHACSQLTCAFQSIYMYVYVGIHMTTYSYVCVYFPLNICIYIYMAVSHLLTSKSPPAHELYIIYNIIYIHIYMYIIYIYIHIAASHLLISKNPPAHGLYIIYNIYIYIIYIP